jgi:hypothetical protein
MNKYTTGYNGGFSIEGSGVVLRCAPDSGIHLPATPAVTCWAIGIRLSSCRTGSGRVYCQKYYAWFYLKYRSDGTR